MHHFFGPLMVRIDRGEFTISGGSQSLKAEVETVVKLILEAERDQEMGPKFFEVLVQWQNEVNYFFTWDKKMKYQLALW